LVAHQLVLHQLAQLQTIASVAHEHFNVGLSIPRFST